MTSAGKPQRRKFPQRDVSWQEHAACRPDGPLGYLSPDLFSEPELARWGLEVCQDCPVQLQCSRSRNGATGVWGNKAFYPRKVAR